jgi:hypothetical protein
MITLQQTINYARTFIQYNPLTAGFGQEPAVTAASIIRLTLLSAPLVWNWNRFQTSFSLTKGTQDYVISVPNLGFVETVSLLDANGKLWIVKDIFNTAALAPTSDQQRPVAMSVESNNGLIAGTALTITNIAITSHVLTVTVSSGASGLSVGQQVVLAGLTTATFLNGQTVLVSTIPGDTSFTAYFVNTNYVSAADTGTATPQTSGFLFRFAGAPDAAYTANLVYQAKAQAFGPFLVASAANAVGSTTTYTGSFDPLSFTPGTTASITGFSTAANNGQFPVIYCNNTSLVVTNSSGTSETPSGGAFAANFNWAPIPDYYEDIYNNLFLSEMFAVVDDARAAQYRQRGVAAFLAKAQGLTDTQKNAFIQQWNARGVENSVTMMKAQQGTQARGV